jgi:hypothetical protein
VAVLYVLLADVTLCYYCGRYACCVLGAESPMLGDGYVKWLLVRVGSDGCLSGSEGLQGLCEAGEPSCLLEVDSCDGDGGR